MEKTDALNESVPKRPKQCIADKVGNHFARRRLAHCTYFYLMEARVVVVVVEVEWSLHVM